MAKPGNTIQEFLEKYRKAEMLLSQLGLDGFRGAEEECARQGMREDADRLRMCRMMRNFASHVPDAEEFLEDGRCRLRYLDRLLSQLSLRIDPVSKHLDRSKENLWPQSAKAWDVMASMAARRRQWIGVAGSTGSIIGVTTIYDVSGLAMGSKAAKLDKLAKLSRPICVAPDVLYTEAPEGDIVFCTADGTPEGKYMGILK